MSNKYPKELTRESIEQMRKDTLAQLPEKTRIIFEMVERDRQIIDKIIEKRIHPKTLAQIGLDKYLELYGEELGKYNLRSTVRFN